ncbi:MAG: DUF1932 domain-containing protein [Gammaproteobacteria bacterium]|nr:DUF1932 domain-containing protein [Gammaproteobacteria bacterium]
MDVAPRLGFVGFGEAAPAVAAGLAEAGLGGMLAYDIAFDPADDGAPAAERFRAKAAASGTRLVAAPAELAAGAALLFSFVTCSEAVAAARALTPHLGPGHLYVDFNSASPAAKREVAGLVEGAGARFVEAAVMAVIPPNRQRAPTFVCGAAAAELRDLMGPFGMRLEVLGDTIGAASAAKMFRSIVVKGLQGLFIECLLAARRYGVEERVLASVTESFPGLDWNDLAHYLTGRSAIHAVRQAHEMDEVAETLAAIGEAPVMARATAERLRRLGELDLARTFEGRVPADYREVLRAIGER